MLVFHEAALTDLREAMEWYQHQQTGLEKRFYHATQETLFRLSEMPDIYPFATKNTRKAKVPSFPYSILFGHTSTLITVYAIFHHSRNPSDWKNRLVH